MTDPPDPSGSKFSLGAALIDAPAAPGHHAPRARAPSAWLLRLARQHGHDVFTGIFTACRAGRDLVLEVAAECTLTLDTSLGQSFRRRPRAKPPPAPSMDAWLRRLTVVGQALSVRGTAPTTLCVETDSSGDSVTAAAMIPVSLRGLSITQLELYHTTARLTPIEAQITASFLKLAGAAFPALTSLKLGRYAAPFPPPTHFPKLTSLAVTLLGEETMDSVCSSIATYLAAVTHCDLAMPGRWSLRQAPWHLVFTNSTHTLTHFTTSGTLADALLSLLLSHCPVLTHLEVDGVDLRDDAHSSRQWPVQRLTLMTQQVVDHRVARLPQQQGSEQLVVVFPHLDPRDLVIPVTSTQGIPATLLRRLSQWRIQTHILSLAPADGKEGTAPLQPEDQPAGLASALRQLSDLQAEGTWVMLHKWQWTGELARVVADVLPTLAHLNMTFGVYLERTLTDELLGLVLQAGPHVRILSVGRLGLETETHANTPWPWERMMIGRCDVSMVAFLPNPQPGTATPIIHITEVDITPSVTEVGLDRLVAWARRVRWLRDILIFVIYHVTASDSPTTTAAQLTLLSALAVSHDSLAEQAHDGRQSLTEFVTQEPYNTQVVLKDWSMTREAMASLQGLPQNWPHAQLDFSKCTWPLQACEYAQLAQHVPLSSFSTYDVGAIVEPGLLDSVCEGVNAHRAGKGQGGLRVRVQSAFQEEQRVGEHVVLTGE